MEYFGKKFEEKFEEKSACHLCARSVPQSVTYLLGCTVRAAISSVMPFGQFQKRGFPQSFPRRFPAGFPSMFPSMFP